LGAKPAFGWHLRPIAAVALISLVLVSTSSCASNFTASNGPVTAASIRYDAPSGDAIVAVSQGAGTPVPGVLVTFVVDSGATIDGAGSRTVTTNVQGLAIVHVVPRMVLCIGLQSFTVTAIVIAPDGTSMAATGSPLAAVPPAIPVPCVPWVMVDVAPTVETPVYANGADSWTGTITLRDRDSNPVIDAPASAIHITVAASDVSTTDAAPTTVVTISPVKNNGDGTYTVQLTSTTPGSYIVTAAYADEGSSTSPPFIFTAVPS